MKRVLQKHLGLIFLWLIAIPSLAQEAQDELFRVVDEMIQPQAEALPDLEDFSESVFRFLTKPLDLNRATADEFRYLPFLTDAEIEHIIDHRKTYGSFSAVEELQAVRGLSLSQARRLRHYCIVTNSKSLADILPNLFQAKNHSLTLRAISNTNQTRNSKYAGGPLHLYGRYRLAKPGAYSLGIIMEKDPGESGLSWNPQQGRYGSDYFSAHLMLENLPGLKRIIIGDYALAFGQGLVFAQGFTLGQNAQTVTSQKKRAQGARPYTSALEGRQLRGVCIVKEVGQVQATVFASRKKLDASQTQPADSLSDNNPFPAFRTIRNTGLHRTASELAGQGVLTEDLVGGQVQLNSKDRLNTVGVTAMSAGYSNTINPQPTAYNSTAFRGDRIWTGSVHYSQTVRNLTFFGESAQSTGGSNGKAWAHYHGVMAALTRQVDVGLSYRDYATAYTAPYAAGFGHSSLTANERGLYLGIQVRPNPQVTVNTAFDIYQKPWLAYRTSRPSNAGTGMMRLTFQPNRQTTLYLQGQRNEFERDLPLEIAGTSGAYFKAPQPISTTQLMATAEFSPVHRWLIRTRVQASQRKGTALATTNGSAILQDVSYQGRYFKISARLSAFSIDDYDNRIYVLERNVLGAYSFNQLNGKGTRYYLLVSAKPTRQLEFWVRIAQTRYANPIESIGQNGVQSTRLSSITEISLQARIWLSPQKINLF